jgi:hypothetical protein
MRKHPTSAPPGAATPLQLLSGKRTREEPRARSRPESTAALPEAAAVVSISRPGDRVLVEYPPGFYDILIQSTGFEDGLLWLYGVSAGVAMAFTARQVLRRLGPHERVGWPAAV